MKRRIEENDKSVAVQKRFIADQDQEKKRVGERFDEELIKLKPLWALAGGAGNAAGAANGAAVSAAPVSKSAPKP